MNRCIACGQTPDKIVVVAGDRKYCLACYAKKLHDAPLFPTEEEYKSTPIIMTPPVEACGFTDGTSSSFETGGGDFGGGGAEGSYGGTD